MKKKFRVGFYYQESGTVIVEADSKEEAEAIVEKKMEEDGNEFVFDCCDRDYGTTGSDKTDSGLSADIRMSDISDTEDIIIMQQMRESDDCC